MLDINLKPPSAVKAVPNGPSASVIFVISSKNCVPPSTTALNVSDDRTDVENSWNVALNFSSEKSIVILTIVANYCFVVYYNRIRISI